MLVYKKHNMIVITGAAGFIGSCLVSFLNEKGFEDLLLVDDFDRMDKRKNLEGKKYAAMVQREAFNGWVRTQRLNIRFVFHIGARTDTTEFNTEIFDTLNLNYSKKVWEYCSQKQIPLIYASSAATYGLGELGYEDRHDIIANLKPLNPYGDSKNDFDKWVINQKEHPPKWYGLKFFNVYGPNEFHKGRMASVIFHAFNQIQQSGKVKLFRSHKAEYEDGKQLRDFIYVKDVLQICVFLMSKQPASGIYNVGTGKARTFWDLANTTFDAMDKAPNIEFIDTPADIREKYQYFTEAKMDKLITNGYPNRFYSLEDGIKDYVQNYLMEKNYF